MVSITNETKDRLNKVPARYKKFINPKVYDPTNKAYTAVILASEQNARTKTGYQNREKMLDAAVRAIISLQKPMYAAWNLMGTEDGAIQRWTERYNKEIALLWGVLKRPKEEQPVFIALPKTKMKRLAFLKTMSELHKYTYEKIGHAPEYCKDTLSNRIADFIDTALYEVVIGNHKIPETKEQARKREEHLQAAIDSLNGLQRPLFALWNIMDYSENIMNEWSELLDTELKLLEGLMEADKERYKKL